MSECPAEPSLCRGTLVSWRMLDCFPQGLMWQPSHALPAWITLQAKRRRGRLVDVWGSTHTHTHTHSLTLSHTHTHTHTHSLTHTHTHSLTQTAHQRREVTKYLVFLSLLPWSARQKATEEEFFFKSPKTSLHYYEDSTILYCTLLCSALIYSVLGGLYCTLLCSNLLGFRLLWSPPLSYSLLLSLCEKMSFEKYILKNKFLKNEQIQTKN